MAPTSSLLQGLNIIQHPSPPSDPQDLSSPFASDLAGELGTWANIHFASDESSIRGTGLDSLSSPLTEYGVRHHLDLDDADEADTKPTSNGIDIDSSSLVVDDHAPMLEHHHDDPVTTTTTTTAPYNLIDFLAGLNATTTATAVDDPFQLPSSTTNFQSIFNSISNVTNHHNNLIIDPALAALSTPSDRSTPTTPSSPSSSSPAKRPRKSPPSSADLASSNATTSTKPNLTTPVSAAE